MKLNYKSRQIYLAKSFHCHFLTYHLSNVCSYKLNRAETICSLFFHGEYTILLHTMLKLVTTEDTVTNQRALHTYIASFLLVTVFNWHLHQHNDVI